MDRYLLYATCIMSVATFLLYGVDKYKAMRKKWRIPEAVLLAAAFLFGGIGANLGMVLFHHKTRKWKFRILVPLFMVVQLLVVLYVIKTPV